MFLCLVPKALPFVGSFSYPLNPLPYRTPHAIISIGSSGRCHGELMSPKFQRPFYLTHTPFWISGFFEFNHLVQLVQYFSHTSHVSGAGLNRPKR